LEYFNSAGGILSFAIRESRKQKAESRNQKAVGSRQKAEGGRQKAVGRNPTVKEGAEEKVISRKHGNEGC